MVATVAEWIWKSYCANEVKLPGINVYEMEVHKPYIAKIPQDPEGQWVEMETTLDGPDDYSGDLSDVVIKCYFRSIRPDGTKIQDQAHCLARFESTDAWLQEWAEYTHLIQTQIHNLRSRARTEAAGRLRHVHRDRAYTLFQSFVDYGPKYQNMSEVIYDTETLEATATLAFQPDLAADCLGPFYMDGSCHVSGFVCNAVEQDAQKNAYVSHGIDGMKLSPKFKPYPGAELCNYVRMEQLASDPSVMQGDVYVLQDGEIVGVWEGVRFKKLPRRVLNVFLPPPRK